MGTRADFYVGTGPDAEWLGSLAFDGYRIDEIKAGDANKSADNMACWQIKSATTDEGFREAVAALLKVNDDATLPAQVWPWPWNDSHTTDYAYAFADGGTKTFPWGEGAEWPDMSKRQNITLGKRSGVIVLGG
jgi:hypothetical protein